MSFTKKSYLSIIDLGPYNHKSHFSIIDQLVIFKMHFLMHTLIPNNKWIFEIHPQILIWQNWPLEFSWALFCLFLLESLHEEPKWEICEMFLSGTPLFLKFKHCIEVSTMIKWFQQYVKDNVSSWMVAHWKYKWCSSCHTFTFMFDWNKGV